MSDERFGDVVEANARFYRAFETLDLEQMDAVWRHADAARCVHPGWPFLTGWDAVRASWEAIFKNTVEMRFTISDVHVAGDGAVAWVTCTENILSQVRGQVSVTSVLATNVFTRAADGWRLVVHHASHVLGGAPAPES
ncbi:MAG: nuclear transport factor 2 family protein [Candidatus Rokubacteria bacterium]|nr:nuclear transport factor 2 family protein [Candidatus Rokubacteria bacterium]